jgi:glycosyltransferase involved in cell wall biosynthesis
MEVSESPMPVPGLLSVVVPLCNEEESLLPLKDEILAALGKLPEWKLQLIFVDDGSTDDSWSRIREMASADPRIRGLRFRRNFGKAAALEAGFRIAAGEIVFTMDADLQDDPAELPKFLQAIRAGNDLVSGYKRKRNDPWHKVYPSRIFNGMVSLFTGVKLHDHNCGYKAYRARVVRDLRLYGELHRFVPVLAAAKGYRVSEIVVQHRARKFGRSKFGVRRFVKGFLDLLQVSFVTGFGYRPMHFFGSTALLAWFLAAGGIAFFALAVILYWLGVWRELYPLSILAITLVLMLFGSQSLLAGYLAELIAAQRKEDPYSIAELTPAPPGNADAVS